MMNNYSYYFLFIYTLINKMQNQFQQFTFKFNVLKKDFETLSKNYDKIINNKEIKDSIIYSDFSKDNLKNGLIMICTGTVIFLLISYFGPKIKIWNPVNKNLTILIGTIGFFTTIFGIQILLIS